MDPGLPGARGFRIDETPPLGAGSGPDPSRVLATAMASCLGSSLLFCLRKARIEVRALTVKASGKLVRNERKRLRVGAISVERFIACSPWPKEPPMPRIQPINPVAATGETATHLATARRMFGGAPNMVTTAAHSPAALEAMLGFFASLGKASLGPKAGEQIAIAQANGCGYCLSTHTATGAMHSLDPATLVGARHAKAADPKTAALLTLAVAINEARGHIDDATLASARKAGLTDTEIVEVVAHVALNVFTNYLNSVAGTMIDFSEVSLTAAA